MMANIPEEMRYDERLVQYERRKGILKTKEYEEHLKKLPDEEANVEYIEIEEEPAEEVSDLTFVSAILTE